MTRPSFRDACATYRNRHTLDHRPAWASGPYTHPDLGAVYYAPQWASDAEWYTAHRFPGEPGLHGNSRHCEAVKPETWPMGRGFLVAPWVKGQPAPAVAE